MRWLLLFAAVGLVGAGCEKTVYRSQGGQYCSSTADDDPYYECSRSSDLVCINTYAKSYPQTDNQPDKVVSMWLCNLACDPTVKNPCADPEEVCCPGPIFGKDYGKKNACVLREFCDALLGMPTTTRDAGSADAKPDAGGTADATGGDLAPDAGSPAPDAGSDAPSDL
jgi:hypothetical protein